jgi:hypothetical protein
MEQWKRFAFLDHGMAAYFRMERLRNGFLLCRYFGVIRRFDASNPAGRLSTPLPRTKKSMTRAAGVHLMWSGEWGWEVSLVIVAPGRPSWAATTRRAVRVHRPYAFGLPSLRAMGTARMRKSINDRHILAMPSHAMAEAELVDASILVSSLRLIRLLPIGMRGRQHDECHIGMTAKEDGEDDRQQQSCSERHWFSVVRVASTGYERHMISCRGASAVRRTRCGESIHECV